MGGEVTMRQYYYKATLANGVSGYDQNFSYKLGINTHPNPDRKGKSACGEGTHLAKTIKAAKKYVPKAKEFYLAEAGVILGEDEDKIRCASCNIIKKLTQKEVGGIEDEQRTEEERTAIRRKLLRDFSTIQPLCGENWLFEHYSDVTQEEIDAQRLIISTARGKVSLSPVLSKKDIRQALSTVKAQA